MRILRQKNLYLDPIRFVQDFLSSLGLSREPAIFASFLLLVCLVSLLCWIANYIAKRYLANFINLVALKAHPVWGKSLQEHKLIRRIASLAPALVIYFCAPLFIITGVKATRSFVEVILLFNQLYVTIMVGICINALLSTFEDIYNGYFANRTPIKSYVQVTRIILFMCVSVIVISLLLDLSPWNFLTGLGAATAVILLIFRDVILGFVASIHISSYDIVRLGDWIEMAQYGIDGHVVEISLTTVKVRNFDKSITTVPTYSLISSGVKNWRGMRESGGRRIKRSISISMRSIKFCDREMLERLKSINLVRDYVESLITQVEGSLIQDENEFPINSAKATNIGVFRNYLQAYLKRNKSLHKHGFDFLVRELQPSDGGLPIEIYVFTNSVDLEVYETIQAEIFDHIIASLTFFDLAAFQKL